MKFEVFNDYGKRISVTKHKECIPSREIAESMLSNRYKIKIDGKIATKKMLDEICPKTKTRKDK